MPEVKLYVWEIVDTIAEYAEAIAIAESKEDAIEVICDSVHDDDLREDLRRELTQNDPEVHSAPYGFYSESRT